MAGHKRLTNDQLYQELVSHGIPAGPVTDSTRNMYEKKLQRYNVTTQNNSLMRPSSSDPIKRKTEQSPSTSNKRRNSAKAKFSGLGSDIIPGLANFTRPSSSVPSSLPPSVPPPASIPPPTSSRYSYHDSSVPSSSPLLISRSDLTPPCTSSHSTPEYRHEKEEEEEGESGILSGVFRMIGEGVKEGVKQIVNKVTGGGGEGERKRRASWIDDDEDYYDFFNPKRLHISPPPSAPPMPLPPKPSAPPKPSLSATPKSLAPHQATPKSPANPLLAPPKRIVPAMPIASPNPVLAPPRVVSYDWELLPNDVTICMRPDGSQWKLGKGGFGEVFKGLKDGVDEVAIKVIHLSNPSAINQFKSEIDLISKLRHKNILQFYGACVKPSFLYMVTELMQSDLFTALRTDKRYTWTGCYGKNTLIGITSGIHYLHSRRPPIVHRDIKSPNILLTDGLAKIADVGIARTKMESDMTAQRGFTIAWAAPEVVYRKRATEKIDIWSLGIILWEIVTGKPPGPGQLVLPHSSSSDLKTLYSNCTRENYTLRPSAADILITLKNMD